MTFQWQTKTPTRPCHSSKDERIKPKPFVILIIHRIYIFIILGLAYEQNRHAGMTLNVIPQQLADRPLLTPGEDKQFRVFMGFET